ncbi:MAG: methyltransferase [Bdellovibrio sp. CG10_big_fil_rev_8_21_14_0_10_47_8]|nr:MAG: methyltransferase [Bdellovibrio sp. CG10_big_fil_rev_8_21_14_0_10_47_8]
MALTLVATPIGHKDDVSQRALQQLRASPVIILEEFKESTQFLRSQGITGKRYETLNEHSTSQDIQSLADLCEKEDVSLITDCGTPGFCDPGAALVKECRRRRISVRSLPGPSSLMTLLSLSSDRLDEFVFRGFPPAETEARKKCWLELRTEKRAMVIMDTPYRFQKILTELNEYLPQRRCLIACDLTQETERIIEDLPVNIVKMDLPKKAEFMVLISPDLKR